MLDEVVQEIPPDTGRRGPAQFLYVKSVINQYNQCITFITITFDSGATSFDQLLDRGSKAGAEHNLPAISQDPPASVDLPAPVV